MQITPLITIDPWCLGSVLLQRESALQEILGNEATLSYDGLKSAVEDLGEEFKAKFSARAFNRVHRFLGRLQDFSRALDVYSQAHPVICLAWGSVRVVLQVSVFPQFQIYVSSKILTGWFRCP
jgi:hypothetical protein